MEISSLRNRNDLYFSTFTSEIHDRGSYLVVKTENKEDIRRGNYLVFNHAPRTGDYDSWTEIFQEEFFGHAEISRQIFTWEPEFTSVEECQEFLNHGFELKEGVLLASDDILFPIKYNFDIEVKPVSTDREWREILDLHKGDEIYQREIVRSRAMVERGLGNWFGAWLDGRLLAHTGVYFERSIARYQNIITHPEFRRRGICQTLVYEAGKLALDNFGATQLVIEADANSRIATVFDSLGFRLREKCFDLTLVS